MPGGAPFTAVDGETISHTLADVLRAPIDFDKLPKETPRAIRDLLRRCLDRDVKNRLRDIGEARIVLTHPMGGTEIPQQTDARPTNLPWAVASVLGLALIVLGTLLWRATRPAEQPLKPLVRLDVDLGSGVSLGSQAGADTIISPDGTRLVYVSQNRLFTRRLDQPTATELAGTEGAFSPFFSPDGQWVAFFAGNKLKKVSVEGGAAITLCDAINGDGGGWGEDGDIIAALSGGGALSRIPSAGGMPTPVTELAQGEYTHRWPQILPGAKAVLFTAHTGLGGFDGANIEVMSFADHRRKTLVRGGTFGRYMPGGHLVYVNRGTLFAVPFDLDTLAVRGSPTPLLERVAYSANAGSAQLDFSRSGTLVYRNGGAGGGFVTVQWLESNGKTQPLLAKPGFYARPRLSPDGQRLALDVTGGSGSDIWVYEWQRDTMTRLTFGGGGSLAPVWSPDGRYVVFLGSGGMSWTRSEFAETPPALLVDCRRTGQR